MSGRAGRRGKDEQGICIIMIDEQVILSYCIKALLISKRYCKCLKYPPFNMLKFHLIFILGLITALLSFIVNDNKRKE